MHSPLFHALMLACLTTGLLACSTGGQPNRLLRPKPIGMEGPVSSPTSTGSPKFTPTSTPPPDDFARDMLDAHNQVRANVNPVPRFPLPPLEWSKEAVKISKEWAAQCLFQQNSQQLPHPIGSNTGASTPGMWTARDVVKAWAGEASHYNLAANTCEPGKLCGHYTQLVWRTTTHVGCVVRTCANNSPFGEEFPTWELWVCTYLPAGNFIGQRPY